MDKENLTEENKQKSDNENISVNDDAKDENVSITTQRKNKNLLKISISCIALLILVTGSIIGVRKFIDYREDIAKAENVISLISDIGEVSFSDVGDISSSSIDCVNRIKAASEAYDNLTDKQKEKVTNYPILADAISKKNSSDYKLALKATALKIYMCELSCEILIDGIEDTWYNAIRKKYDKYNNGNYDINIAIPAYLKDSSNAETLSMITSSKSNIDEDLKLHVNPPEDCKDAYNALLDVYSVMNRAYEMATSPSGSYNSYSSNSNEVSTDFTLKYSKLNALMPEFNDLSSKS